MIDSRSRTWHLESGDPMHNEVGFLRAKPGTSTLAFTIAQNSGIFYSTQYNAPMAESGRGDA